MTLNEARMIREIKKGCTYRRLAEIYYPPEHQYHGIQGCGEDLCREALTVLYPNDDVWMMFCPEEKLGSQFDIDNLSRCFLGYWWE